MRSMPKARACCGVRASNELRDEDSQGKEHGEGRQARWGWNQCAASRGQCERRRATPVFVSGGWRARDQDSWACARPPLVLPSNSFLRPTLAGHACGQPNTTHPHAPYLHKANLRPLRALLQAPACLGHVCRQALPRVPAPAHARGRGASA